MCFAGRTLSGTDVDWQHQRPIPAFPILQQSPVTNWETLYRDMVEDAEAEFDPLSNQLLHHTRKSCCHLKLTAVFLVYRHFLPFLKYIHILVRTDESTVGRTCSVTQHRLAYSLIMWSSKDLPSLCTTHLLVHRPGKWESP